MTAPVAATAPTRMGPTVICPAGSSQPELAVTRPYQAARLGGQQQPGRPAPTSRIGTLHGVFTAATIGRSLAAANRRTTEPRLRIRQRVWFDEAGAAHPGGESRPAVEAQLGQHVVDV